MLDRFLNTNFKKIIAFGAGFLLSLLLIYNLAISKTTSLYKAKKDQENLLQSTGKLTQELFDIEQQLNTIQASSIKPYDKKYMLQQVTDFCSTNDLMIISFPATQSREASEYEILTNEIEVKGAYKKIVELIYLIERIEKVGSISNVKFSKIKNKKTKREELVAKIVIRNLAA